MRGTEFILCLQLAASACADVNKRPGTSRAHENAGEPRVATSSESDTNLVNRDVSEHSLDGQALRALFSDVYVEPVRPAGDVVVSHWPGEIFQSDGIYVRIPNRTRLYGTFEIRGDLVCVQGGGIVHQCWRVISNEDNTYSLIDTDNQTTMQVTITPHN